ncbi:MAG: DUF4286 family protein [Flavobacteriales bacterium]|jgi:antibiotic biosynthesis monooxygenase (ABM) superfamily enzyme|nr:DUF4286 family protein [Flavobacteriales bacterium]NCG29870.1 DUF4286 family protein [Bacteroidota bacterium]MBT4705118.1 DUF4286 family protein [Flavobacteriales bacterium]MBT4930138.1 DUF4286 family protein [Flavobacteriales bacterium]MBT5133096.1 DUF4286 family protein [Flavobacteriales bacterium]
MIIYNVTVKIDNDVHDDWLEWMKDIHIPQVLETGYFEGNLMAKVLVDDDDGVTYSIQYRCLDMKRLEEYYESHAPRLQKDHAERYKDKFVAFRTLLEVVE